MDDAPAGNPRGQGPASPAQGPKCPICGQPVAPDAKTLPFCSSRCRLVDLGRWFRGQYAIGSPPGSDDDFTEPPDKPPEEEPHEP